LSLCLDHPLFSTLLSPPPAPKGEKKKLEKSPAQACKDMASFSRHLLGILSSGHSKLKLPHQSSHKNEKERSKKKKKRKGEKIEEKNLKPDPPTYL
jgi:hypothetical protein